MNISQLSVTQIAGCDQVVNSVEEVHSGGTYQKRLIPTLFPKTVEV